MKSFLQKNWIIFLSLILVLLVAGLVLAGVISLPPRDVACTLDAKVCPDGSAVGRMGPNCEFAACPETPSLPNGYTLQNYKIEKVTGESCAKHADCTLPGEYAVQSRCPFVSLCLENSCAVVCPSFKGYEITNYEECVAAGFAIMKSNPPQCATPEGKIFFETQ